MFDNEDEVPDESPTEPPYVPPPPVPRPSRGRSELDERWARDNAAREAAKVAAAVEALATGRAAMAAILANPARRTGDDLDSLLAVNAWLHTHQKWFRINVRPGPAWDALNVANKELDKLTKANALAIANAEAANADLVRRVRNEAPVPVPTPLLQTLADVDAMARWLLAHWDDVVRCEVRYSGDGRDYDEQEITWALRVRLAAWTVWHQLQAQANAAPDIAEQLADLGLDLLSSWTTEPELRGLPGTHPIYVAIATIKPERDAASALWEQRLTTSAEGAGAAPDDNDEPELALDTSTRRIRDRQRADAIRRVYWHYQNLPIKPTAAEIFKMLKSLGARGQQSKLLKLYRAYEDDPDTADE